MPRWAIGRLPELAIALTTLGRVQGNVTVLARQMECEEASVRAWLLRLRALGDLTPDVPPPEPEIRLRTEADRLRDDLNQALTQRNKLDEELREHKEQTSSAIAKLKKDLEDARQQLGERASLLTQSAREAAVLKADEANARLRVQGLQAQHSDDQAEISRLRQAVAAAKENLKSGEEKLHAAEQERARLDEKNSQMTTEVAMLRGAAKNSAGAPALHAAASVGAARQQTFAMPESIPTNTRSESASAEAARQRLDERVEGITRFVCLAFLKQAKQGDNYDAVKLWLSQHASKIHLAAQTLTRVALWARMEQDGAITVAKAAHEAYRQALDRVGTASPAFVSWFEESKGFLILLATAIVAALDARSSTDSVSATKGQAP